jgi:hypothetical protein
MNQIKFWSVILTIASLISFGKVNAQSSETQPLQEVFQTELVYPQEKGEFQLTFAPRFSRRDDERTTDLPVRLEYGITNRWQVEVEWNTLTRRRSVDLRETEKSTGDVSVSTKYSFLNIKKSNFHSSVQFEVEFPTGNVDKELSEGFIKYQPSVSFAKDFPRLNRLQIFSQVGVNLKQRVKKPRDLDELEPGAHEFILNGGFFLPVKKARFVSEVNWNTDQWNKRGRNNEVYLTPGFVYKLSGRWEIGIGVPIGVTPDADKFRTILQAVFEF